MQEKILPNQTNSTSNIHSMDFGSVSYDIFGSPYQKSGSFLANDSLDFGYLGKPYNADTELYDYGFRDYSPNIARFTTVDPIRDGRNWYSYVVNDPVNYVDLWGLCSNDGKNKEERNVIVTLYNSDPTPNSNEIISSTGNVGHTWIGIQFPNSAEIFLGWGSTENPSDGKTHPGALIDTKNENESSGSPTSTYIMFMTETEANAIINYYENLEEIGVGYNLGGASLDSFATMCSESAIGALTSSGGLTNDEKSILNAKYDKWQESYPKTLPKGFENIGRLASDNTAPNPNAVEDRIEQLNNKK